MWWLYLLSGGSLAGMLLIALIPLPDAQRK